MASPPLRFVTIRQYARLMMSIRRIMAALGFALAADANRAANWVLAHPEELKVPLLLCHGEQDPIARWKAAASSRKRRSVRFVEFERRIS